ncbi:MAG: ABC-F family ATP-binding cassette domain-containing protein [Desulfopila sp.]
MLSVNHLDIRYGEKYLFKDVSVQVYEGNRIGLVGVNGAGKSTLLKIMAGVSASDDGVVAMARHATVAYLPQESNELLTGRTLYQEAQTAFDGLIRLQEEGKEIHAAFSRIAPDSPEFERLLQRQGEIQHRLDGSGIYAMQARIEKVLLGLGFKAEDMEKPASTFSGGWLMRLKLAKMLLEEPSLLLLDEPTNHLDLESLTWVEEFLRNYRGAMVVVSHDRAFLDKATTATWEISSGRVTTYKGNYTFYLAGKEERRNIERAAYDNQQARINQTMRFVERFRAKSTKAKQVQSRLKQLDKMELIELADDEQNISFSFPPAPPSGRDVLQVENLEKSYGGRRVFDDVQLQLQRGDKVAVVGVNGAGKSTLLKILAGMIEGDRGQVRYGANVKLSYFGQHQAQELSPQLSALETMALSGEELTMTRMRSLLGAFLFRGEEVEKKVAVLSGGEKSRLALAKMIATPANLMLLDEPTNHLDMGSQEILQEAMAQYDGTIVVVSHNRYFVDSFVNRVLEVKGGRITMYEGNVNEYLEKMAALAQQMREAAPLADQQEPVQEEGGRESGQSRKERKRQEAELRQRRAQLAGRWLQQVEEAEGHIETLEVEKEDLEALMADPELYADGKAWSETSRRYDDCKRRLERWYERWEKAQEEIEKIDARLASAT